MESFKSMLEEFMKIMELPEFQEVDKRLTKLYNSELQNTDNYNQTLTTEQFIYILLNELSNYVSDSSLIKIRKSLYKHIDLITKIINNKKPTKQSIQKLLRTESIKSLLLFFSYESGEDILTIQLIDELNKLLT